jgi:hypothetical protein
MCTHYLIGEAGNQPGGDTYWSDRHQRGRYNDRMSDDSPGSSPLLCARCSAELTPGKGDFYIVRIEAVADPTPPSFSEDDLKRDHRAEIERLVSQMRDLSEQEAMYQVYRRLVLCLCGPCYRDWIENPVG